jgi:hypothetical protein
LAWTVDWHAPQINDIPNGATKNNGEGLVIGTKYGQANPQITDLDYPLDITRLRASLTARRRCQRIDVCYCVRQQPSNCERSALSQAAKSNGSPPHCKSDDWLQAADRVD